MMVLNRDCSQLSRGGEPRGQPSITQVLDSTMPQVEGLKGLHVKIM